MRKPADITAPKPADATVPKPADLPMCKPTEAAVPPLEMQVRGVKLPKPHLEITLINHMPESFEVFEEFLPWNRGMTVLVSSVGGNLLEQQEYTTFFDCTHPEVELKPETPLTGSFDLTEQFPEFVETLARKDLIVFWTYQCQPEYGPYPTFPRSSGAVLFEHTPSP